MCSTYVGSAVEGGQALLVSVVLLSVILRSLFGATCVTYTDVAPSCAGSILEALVERLTLPLLRRIFPVARHLNLTPVRPTLAGGDLDVKL